MTPAFDEILEGVRAGNAIARNALYESAFHQLRARAAYLLRRERRGHSLRATAMVGEIFLKLRSAERLLVSEDHFYRLAWRALKQVLIDHSRTTRIVHKVSPDDVAGLLANRQESSPELRLSVQAVFRRLERYHALTASTMWMRCVEGLTWEELSKIQNRAVWPIRDDYAFGLKWMANRLRR